MNLAVAIVLNLIANLPIAGIAYLPGPPPKVGSIHHQTVEELPGPRNRLTIGIGEQVSLWIDPAEWEDIDYVLTKEGLVPVSDEIGVMTWTSVGAGSVFPIVGSRTTLTADLASADGQICITVTIQDSGTKGKDQAVHLSLGQNLAAALTKLDELRKGRETPLATVDERGARLLKDYSSLGDRGRIYYQLAHVHAQSGLRRPEKVIEYTKKALEYPLDTDHKLRLYVYWGDALQVTTDHPLVVRRKAAATAYLDGLAEVLKYKLPEKAPELPPVFIFDAVGDDPQAEQLRQRHKQAVEVRKQAEFQREMIGHREVLISQIVGLYRQKPAAIEELQELAKKALKSQAAVDRLLGAVKTR